jgi:pyridoxal phosphate enzyme (YggS family)
MSQICDNLRRIRDEIHHLEARYGRPAGSVRLLAVSKTKPVTALREALDCGQRAFGENYVQELAEKGAALAGEEIEWHYIGPLQSNKSRIVAETAHWMHTVDRLKIARRLSEQRPADSPPLNICIQVNISGEASKSGIELGALPELVAAVAALPNLRLRGLMAIPAPSADVNAQRAVFARLRQALEDEVARGHALDTLSMGMTGDMEAAIAEGATIVRIGTAIFGARG